MERKKYIIKVSILYGILFAGLIWHFLGIIDPILEVLAGPLLIALAIWAVVEIYLINKDNAIIKWSLLIAFFSWLAEYIGVVTGEVFGHYSYSNILTPTFASVPLAIGFCWVMVCLGSFALVSYYLPKIKENILLVSILSGLLATAFDFILEPTAIKLNYWTWLDNVVPLKNYISWFILSSFFVLVLHYFNLHRFVMPKLIKHFYTSQFFYLALVNAIK